MRTKRILLAVLASSALFAASCSTNSTADEDQLYQDGVDRTKITTSNRKEAVDRTKITTSNRQSVDRTKITTSNRK